MTVQVRTDYNNYQFILEGLPFVKESETIAQDAARAAILYKYTVMSQSPLTRKWVPLTSVSPTLTAATLVCGANGGNIAAYQAVTDGEFSFLGNDYTGLDFSSATDFDDVADIINAALLGAAFVIYDIQNDIFTFVSNGVGADKALTYLSAVSGGSGTDISSASFLTGVTGSATLTAGTGNDGTNLPTGIYMGGNITAAELVAGDVVNRPIITGGEGVLYDSALIILENSLTLNSVVVAKQKTIDACFNELGLFKKSAVETTELEN